MTAGERVLGRARACLGVRFRAQGRDPALGLDCVGLAIVALERSAAPADYAMRGRAIADVASAAIRAGLDAVAGEPQPGDLLLFHTGPGQLHLAIAAGAGAGAGIVHADARARQVVERPGPPPWSCLGIWRPHEGEE